MASERDDPTIQFASVTPPAGSTQDTASIPAVSPRDVTGEVDTFGGLMPMLDDPRRRFDSVMRGYDRHQVDQYVAKLEDDNRLLSLTRTEGSTRMSDLAAQLASAQAEIEALRRRLTASTQTIDPENVDARVQEVVALAQQVARQTRSDAENDARRIHQAATGAADALRTDAQRDADLVDAAATQRLAEADDTYSRKVTEADRHAGEVSGRAAEELRLSREEVASLRAVAAAEVGELRAVAAAEVAELRSVAAAEVALQRQTAADEIGAAESASSTARTEADRVSREAREQADAEAARRRRTAEEDFEITLRLRRRAEEDEDRERRTTAAREASTIVSDAHTTADRIVREARDHVERLDQERRRAHTELGVIASRLSAVVSEHDPAANPLSVS